MPRPIQVLTVREFEKLLEEWTQGRKVTEVHVHCTDQPRHGNFRGLASIEAMRTVHMSLGMVDIAQHLTVDPQGLLWTGRPFDLAPASVRGHNGDAKQGPFMIEMIGLFEKENGKVVDTFEGDQKNAAYAAVCAVLRRFDLKADAVRFHREFPATGKTCPGSDLDPKTFRTEIGKALETSSLRGFDVPLPIGVRESAVDRAAVLEVTEGEDLSWAEVPEDPGTLAGQTMLAGLLERGLVEPASQAARGEEVRNPKLLRHLVNTSQGVLSKKGALRMRSGDLENLVERSLVPGFDSGEYKHLLFYAHGGLNNEKVALKYANAMAPWWCSFGVYPIFFVWESGVVQAILGNQRAMRGTARGIDNVTAAVLRTPATAVWSRIKANARRCSQEMTDRGEPGGLYQLWKLLEPWLDKNRSKVSIHAIGHSTGPILLASFLKRLIDDGGHTIESLNYLAPAIRIDEFQRDVEPYLGRQPGVRQLRVFTMTDEAERNDDLIKPAFNKSLLYFVREACEGPDGAPILGLERDLYGNRDMRSLFGLDSVSGALSVPDPKVAAVARATVDFSPPEYMDVKNPATSAQHHGDFDNNEDTMKTVLARMLGKASKNEIYGDVDFPSVVEFEDSDPFEAGDGRGVGEGGAVEDECCCCCCRRQQVQGSGEDRKEEPDPELDGDPDADFGAGMKPEPKAPSVGAGTSSPDRSGTAKPTRRALCVGIDKYPRQPLAGCVQDSENWAQALAKEGFEVKKLQNGKATRAALDKALRELLQGAKPGDQLVFQYAGHGAQVEDLSGDDHDGFDEVMVPVDFDRGELWLDDDVYAACKTLPKGAFLTLVTDCCHSGTNARFAPVLGATRGGASRDVRARYIALNAREIAAYKRKWVGSRAAAPVSEREPLPGVVHFAACQDKEVAYEEEGQGNFSRHALGVLGEVLGKKGSNRQFHQAIERAFGTDKRQHPVFDKVAPGLAGAPLFGGR